MSNEEDISRQTRNMQASSKYFEKSIQLCRSCEKISNFNYLKFLQGLLRFALQATQAEDAPADPESRLHQMNPERRQFLGEYSFFLISILNKCSH